MLTLNYDRLIEVPVEIGMVVNAYGTVWLVEWLLVKVVAIVVVAITWGVEVRYVVEVLTVRNGFVTLKFWQRNSATIVNRETARAMVNSAASRAISTQTLRCTRNRRSVASIRGSGLTYTQFSEGALSDCVSGDPLPLPLASSLFISVIYAYRTSQTQRQSQCDTIN